MQKFYIGALELIFNNLENNDLQQFDALFQNPVLPITKKLLIDIKKSISIDIPFNVNKLNDNIDTWYDDIYKCRLYHYGDEIHYLSRKNNNSVLIQVENSYYDKYKNEFRPWFQIHLEEFCLENNALILHSASIEYRSNGILFTAPSGTGKTTQTDLWYEYVDGISDINADRTLLQRTDNGWFACGFPLYGTVFRCEQKARSIEAIVIIRQGKKNEVHELSLHEKVSLIYSECTVPNIESYVSMAMDLIIDLVQNVKIILYYCNMEKDAVDVLYRYLYHEEIR
ncbi:MAG: hypothetical protein LUH02_07915 [Erysipelotrichaceae bacterium]|nr:hypothetical protein [Erysipelotrichaceae bacterium]